MDSTVRELLQLHQQGTIDGQALNAALKALRPPAPIPVPRKRPNVDVQPVRPTPRPRKRRSVSNDEMDTFFEELLAEQPKQPKHPTIPPPPAQAPPSRQLKWDNKTAFSYLLRAWRMRVPQGHPSDRDLMAFLESAQPHIHRKLTEELLAQRGVKFQLAVEVELRKEEANGIEVLTTPSASH